MRATELRIGNLFYYHIKNNLDERKEWDEVGQIDYEDLKTLTEFDNNSEYKPIPLTEEWLLKFGFKKNYKRGYILKINSFLRIAGFQTIPHLYLEYEENYCLVTLEYVHQLQNLYFALTENELEITEKL